MDGNLQIVTEIEITEAILIRTIYSIEQYTKTNAQECETCCLPSAIQLQ